MASSIDELFEGSWWGKAQAPKAPPAEHTLLLQRLEHQNEELKASLQHKEEELKRQEELLEEMRNKDEAHNIENSILAAQLQSLHEAKNQLCQEKQRLEQENEFLLMERWFMFEQLGIDPDSEQCSLLQALSQQVHAAQQGLEAVGHLQRLGIQLQRLAQHDYVTSLPEPPRPQLSWATSRSLSNLSSHAAPSMPHVSSASNLQPPADDPAPLIPPPGALSALVPPPPPTIT